MVLVMGSGCSTGGKFGRSRSEVRSVDGIGSGGIQSFEFELSGVKLVGADGAALGGYGW